MTHIVLLGDSVFDNGSYVPGELPVIEQLGRKLPDGGETTLLAVDGGVTSDVVGQLARVPSGATHLVVSAGGNDALGHSGLLYEPAESTAEVLGRLAEMQTGFRRAYRQMLEQLLAAGLPTVVCTVYDAIPGLGPPALAALSLFNDVITHEAFRARVPIVELRLVCTEPSDYSDLSPIEPSYTGGEKIASAIIAAVTGHDFAASRSAVYP